VRRRYASIITQCRIAEGADVEYEEELDKILGELEMAQ
jgi:hypothetical protein